MKKSKSVYTDGNAPRRRHTRQTLLADYLRTREDFVKCIAMLIAPEKDTELTNEVEYHCYVTKRTYKNLWRITHWNFPKTRAICAAYVNERQYDELVLVLSMEKKDLEAKEAALNDDTAAGIPLSDSD